MRSLWVAFVTIICMTACKKDGCNVPSAFNYDPDGNSSENCIYEPLTLRVTATPYFGEDIITEGTEYQTESGRKISFIHVGMFFSELRLSSTKPDLDVLYMTLANRTQSFETSVFPQGDLTDVSFTVGIDSGVYKTEPLEFDTTHPLGPKVPDNWWGWASGYRYISMEGRVDTSAVGTDEATGFFTYHVGLDTNLRSFTFSDPIVDPVNKSIDVNIKVDLKEALKDIDFTTEQVTHTSNNLPLAVKVANGTANAITLE